MKLRVFLTTLVCLVVPAAAPAKAPLDGLHNTRYCEILELKGQIPDASVTVWNTVGLNFCPPAKWHFDAAALAKELDDNAVILNGPRYWLIDSVVGKVGRTRAFHGLKMRRVASIAIHSSDDLVRAPYSERTITRHNTWHFNAGRRVFELVAPSGKVYVMQSYNQIIDPTMTIGDLPGLGPRLKLPDGWRYRARRLKHPLDMVADGSATILQDDLQNTYQLKA